MHSTILMHTYTHIHIFHTVPTNFTTCGSKLTISNGGSVLTQTSGGEDYHQLGSASDTVAVTEGVAWWEVKITKSQDMGIMVGAVRPGLDHNTKHRDSDNAYYLWVGDGSLWGNGKSQSDKQGKLKVGDRVGVLVRIAAAGGNANENSVLFYVNVEKYGPGFKGAVVKGPLVLGVQLADSGDSVTIVDSAPPAGAP